MNGTTTVASALGLVLTVQLAPGKAARSATCRSDRITYVSDDGKREFVVAETRRGAQAVPHAGGTLTKEVQVIKGHIGAKTFYVYERV